MKNKKLFIISSFAVIIILVALGLAKVGGDETLTKKKTKAGAEIQGFLKEYYKYCKVYPLTEQGLKTLKENNNSCGYFPGENVKNASFKDGNAQDFLYFSNGTSFSLISVAGAYYEWSNDSYVKFHDNE